MVNQPFIRAPEFFDGLTAKKHVVRVDPIQTGLALIDVNTEEVTVWPFADLRRLPDQARDGGMLLTLSTNPEARLNMFDARLVEQIEALCPDLKRQEAPKGSYRKVVMWTAGAAASVLVILFVIIPLMANSLAGLIPMKREVALGETVLVQIEKFLTGDFKAVKGGLTCSNPKGVAALDKMTARLLENHETPYDLKIQVYDHDMVNAFAVPGGHVVLMKGLIEASTSPEEVAGVLGHEMGHVDHRDSTRAILRTAGTAGILGMVLGDFTGGFAVLLASEQVINASYAQEAETNADSYAHDRFAEAALPTTRLGDFFLRLKEEHGDTEGFMSHLASHPNLQGRADAAVDADTIGDQSYTPVLSETEWQDLRQICDKDE